MKRFSVKSLFDRTTSKDSVVDSTNPLLRTALRFSDKWARLERAIQRGRGEEVTKWRQEWQVNTETEEEDDEEGDKDMEKGEGEEERRKKREEEMLCQRYIRRSSELPGLVCLSPLQLAIMERKREVVAALLTGLGDQQLIATLSTRLIHLKKASKKFLSDTKKMFSVASISVSTISEAILNAVGNKIKEVDWSDAGEWTAIHLAIKYDVESLKVVLHVVESQLEGGQVEALLAMRDTKGRGLLHLAAKNQASSTALKLLLDCGVKVDSADECQVTPLHMAAKYGVVDTARELLEHGADKDRCHVDITGRGALHYAHSPDMIRFLLSRGYAPNLEILKYQTSHRGVANVKVLLENSVSVEGDLLVLDFSLAMEKESEKDTGTDVESVFLRNFLIHRSLLHVPLVEALLQMKWFACRRVIIIDLLIYMCFICCLTAVICLSTKPPPVPEDSELSSTESAMVDLLIESYRSELERRGWRFYPRSTSHLDKYKYNFPENYSVQHMSTVIELETNSQEYSKFLGLYFFTVFLSFLFLMREFLELVADGIRTYFSSVENIFEVFIICLTVLCQIFLQFYSENVYFYEILQVMTVFFGWLGLTFHLAKLPTVGIFIYLAIKVFKQLVLSLLVFTTILLAFAFSFHLAMRKHHVFDNAFTSFLKMINMMAGEYNFDENFTFESVRSVGGSNGIVQILLVSFTLLVSVTIANLIVALVIANMNKLMEEADAHQLGKTVDLLSKVHNVKQALIRIFPCLKHVFAPTLYDYIGKKTTLCVKISEANPKLSLAARLQNSFMSSTVFYPVYTYDSSYRKELELTDLALPDRIVKLACENCKLRERDRGIHRFEGNSADYSSEWRLGGGGTETKLE